MCVSSCTKTYSRQYAGFLAKPVLKRTLRRPGLQLPHLVFIFLYENALYVYADNGSPLGKQVWNGRLQLLSVLFRNNCAFGFGG